MQFATHGGLCRALRKEVIVGGRRMEVEAIKKEFRIGILEGRRVGFGGPRCCLDGDEIARVVKWQNPVGLWHKGPYGWCYGLEGSVEGPIIEE